MLRLLTNTRVLVGVAIVGGLLAVALWPTTVPVDTAVVARGPLVVTIDEEGRTRVRHRFVVSAPVTGRVLRIELEPGDTVKRGDVVARVRAETPALLDTRSRAEAQAAVESARNTQGRARAEEQRARTTLAQAERELARARELAKSGLTTPGKPMRARRTCWRPPRRSRPPSMPWPWPRRSCSGPRRASRHPRPTAPAA